MTGSAPPQRTSPPEWIRRHAILVTLGWVLLAGVLNAFVPQLERVVAEHSPPFLPKNSRAMVALTQMARAFGDGDSSNVIYVGLSGDDELGDDARDYYTRLMQTLRAEPMVDSVMDLWSDPVASAAGQSADHRMVYVQLWLKGDMGETLSFQAIDRVEQIVEESNPPGVLRTYVTGPAAVVSDEFRTADRDVMVISTIGVAVILTLLLAVYRSLVTAVLPLVSVGLALLVARPVISLLGIHEVIGVSMFASAMSAALILGAGTDYTIFFLGRYHEARTGGKSRHQAYLEAYHGVNHIVVASTLTIAGACACLWFTQISVLKTAGIPCAIGILVGLLAALTLTPALVTLAGRRVDPAGRVEHSVRWRRIGTAIVRWPIPTFLAATAVLVPAALLLPTMRMSFNEVGTQRSGSTSVAGMAELARHFPDNQATPDFVTITADHDMRNPSDAVAIEEVSRALAKLPDVGSVQSITRPTGRLLAESLLVNQAGTLGGQLEQGTGLAQDRLADARQLTDGLTAMLGEVDDLQQQIDAARRAFTSSEGGLGQATDGMEAMQRGADLIADAIEPLRRLVSADPDCADGGLCATARTALAAYDGFADVTAGAQRFAGTTDSGYRGMQSVLDSLGALRQTIAALQARSDRVVGTLDVLSPQLDTATGYLREVGRNFGASESGVFYLPQQVFDDPRFAVVLRTLYAPDGRTTRLLLFGNTPSFGQSGIDRAREIERVAGDTIRGGRLDGSVVQVGGVGAIFSDVQQIIDRDTRILVIVTLLFVFSVVLVVLRSLVAGLVVVTTVAVSFATALGLSVAVWQHLLGQPLHWAVPPLAFIALVAVGSDYNLLFTARLREEAVGGLRTGIIRAFAGTGSVVTVAGVVFAGTMFAMLGSNLTNIMQLGSTVGMGLLVDTFVVRAVVVPAIAAQFGVWFWWPLTRRELLGAGGRR